MRVLRSLPCFVFAATATFCLTCDAQLLPGAPSRPAAAVPVAPPAGVWLPGGRSYLGLNLERTRSPACSGTALTCDSTQPSAQLYTGTMFGNFWGAELAYSNTPRIAQLAGDAPAQGLTVSLLGRAKLLPSIGLYGKLGTTYGQPSGVGAARVAARGGQGFGLSFGAGLSFDFTPRLSATLQWDSTDTPMLTGGRDPVRSTSLGLKFRY